MSDKTMIFRVILVFIYFICVFSNSFIAYEDPIVETSSGKVKGTSIKVLDQDVHRFLGIPYAEPPLGALRFQKPKPITKPLEGIIDCTKPKYSCIQGGNINKSEDCLVLNIWTQKNNSPKLKPVMFWIYGGGLVSGSIFHGNDGSVLVTQDVVYVAVNYRLGPLGFLYGGEESAPGNQGFYDQRLGLQWVRENIHLFGGDKNLITIFGESSGSHSVSAHVLSPLSEGLFKRAIMQSQTMIHNKDRPGVSTEEALTIYKHLAKSVNCTDDKQWLECLRKVDSKLLVLGVVNPIEGTEFLPLSPQKAFIEGKFNKDLDIMGGVCKDEGYGFSMTGLNTLKINISHLTKDDFVKFINYKSKHEPRFPNLNAENITKFYLNNVNTSDSKAIMQKISDFYGDILIKCPTYLFAKSYAERSVPETNVFFYELTEGVGKVVNHGADIHYMFGLPLLNPNSSSKDTLKLSKDMVRQWTNFAKIGKPDNNWPKLIDTKTHPSIIQIKDLTPESDSKYFHNLFEQTCDGFWKNYF